MSHSLSDYPPKRADEWEKKIRRYMQHKDLIYSVEFNRYDDMAGDDMAMKMLKALSSTATTLDVYATIKVWNANVERVLNGNTFGCEQVRFYESWGDGNTWHTIAEFERSFEYDV